ncbi:hypothetical protein LCGC14_1932390 [marine sediment metagenome]|uniref:Uncharacterized protein n=1 Tax=marine sediment metagenome TaxID=412755 RepID=A0A0F9IK80_9ZZZZ
MEHRPLPAPYQDPTWQQQLDAIAPHDGTDDVWLHLYWEEGYPWEPINRWMIGKVLTRIPLMFRDALEGPDPRTQGHYDEIERVFKTKASCSRRQWDYFQKTGHMLQSYWVVQGGKGGHRVDYNQVEGRISALHGGPQQPPRPGDLQYQAPNQITFEALTNIRALLGAQAIIRSGEGTVLAADEKRGLETMRGDVWNWMKEQMEESCDELAFHMKDEMHMAPDGDSSAINRGLEEVEESFITEGA